MKRVYVLTSKLIIFVFGNFVLDKSVLLNYNDINKKP